MKRLIAIILLMSALVLGGCSKAKEEEFQTNLKSLATGSFDLAVKSESVGVSYLDVWRNAIYDKTVVVDGKSYSDFNDALYAQSLLFAENGTNSDIDKRQSDLKELFNELKDNQIEKFSNEFEIARDFYLKTVEFSSYATDPQGSYTSFSDGFATRRDEISSKYSSVKIELDIE